jgi:predicted ATPase/class 3 adenylate cyclase
VTELPTGTVTFLFTDLEGSTPLWDQHPEAMKDALARHDAILGEAVAAHRGHVIKTTGDGVHAVFDTARDAVGAAVAGQRVLAEQRWGVTGPLRVRMGIHTGEAQLRDGDYYGTVLNRAARLTSVASGAQIVVSQVTADLLVDDLPGVALVDVGEHELKGLHRPETLYLVAAPGLDATTVPRPPDRAVGQRNSLVGRVEVLARLEESLARPGLVTVVGPGGIGKTRVLHEMTGRLGDEFSRTWVVDLVGARDGPAIESAVQAAMLPQRASTTGLPDIESPDFTAQVVSVVGSRRVLLAVDNCEHIVDAVSGILGGLLARCPGLSILATSREPLAVAGGRVIRLGPLELPPVGTGLDVEALGEAESVRLVLDRVRDAGGELRITPATAESLAEICLQLDGIPLALELAAARLTMTTPAELLGRLSRQLDVLKSRSQDERHRTLHSAIDWSYQLLDETEQTLLRRLGIFVGGFSLEAAEEVCSGTEDEPPATADDIYLTLVELVSKSLVVFDQENGRYRLLEPIRLFAFDQLERSHQDNALSARHAQWILHYSRAALAHVLTGGSTELGPGSPVLTGGSTAAGPGSPVAFRADLDNAHSALDWLHHTGDNKTFQQIVAALGTIWFMTDWRRGQEPTAIAVEMAANSSPRLRAAVLLSRGMVELRAANFDESTRCLTEARSAFAALGDTLGLAWSTFFLAMSFGWASAQPEQVDALWLEAASLFRELEMPVGEAWSLINLTTMAYMRGDLELSQHYFDQVVETTDSAAMTWVQGGLVAHRAQMTLEGGDIDQARREIQEGIALMRDTGDHWNLPWMIVEAAWIEIAAEQFDRAEALSKDALREALEYENVLHVSEALVYLAVVSFKRGDDRHARELVAASGWDLDPPFVLQNYPNSAIARALDLLHPIFDRHEDAARDGRALGAFDEARAITST